jgi:hypothetical protein
MKCANSMCQGELSTARADALVKLGKRPTCIPCARRDGMAAMWERRDHARVPLGVPMPSNGFGR